MGKLQEKGEQQSEEVDQQIRSSIERESELAGSESSEIGTLGHNGDLVYTGSDTRMYSYDYSNSGTSGIWGNKSSSAEPSTDRIFTEIAQAPSYGNAWAWAYLADEFEVRGNSSEFCTVSSSIYYDGYLWSAAGGTSEITITFELENQSQGHSYTKTHLDESYTGLSSTNYFNSTDSEATTVQLHPSDRYRVTVRAEAHTSIMTLQGATVDFGNMQDGNEYIRAQYYDFDF